MAILTSKIKIGNTVAKKKWKRKNGKVRRNILVDLLHKNMRSSYKAATQKSLVL